MGTSAKRAYLDAIGVRYRRSGQSAKGRILDEFCSVCGYNRKYAIRLLNRRSSGPKRRRGRRSPYATEPGFMDALQRIWAATDFMCSSRLKASIPLWLPFYSESFGPPPPRVCSLLLTVSRATLDRLLGPLRQRYGRGRCGTKPGTMLRSQIAIRSGTLDISKPGFVEADTVAHCGTSLAGDFVWSLILTDIHTAWTESRAVWNKGSTDVVTQTRNIEQCLPFQLLGFDCDNGSEFLNHHLLKYFAERDRPVHFTRSRPYRKNDNAHVEQKNWAHARHLLGYHRISDPALVAPINELYAHEWSLLQNHFCPNTKLLSKTRIRTRYRKTYAPPVTPYQRVMDCPHVSAAAKKRLKQLHQQLNPFQLKVAKERKLKAIFRHVRVTTNVRQRI